MNDMFCYIAAATSHVNLGFCRGASLPDPDRVVEINGKMMRHVKFRSDRDFGTPFVRRYIRAATEQARTMAGRTRSTSAQRQSPRTASRP